MKNLVLLGVGLGLALVFKWSGRLGATLYRTDATSARWTVAEHLALAGRLFAGAILFTLLIALAFVLPPSFALWVVTVGIFLLVLLNLCLGGLSGACESLGRFLARARRWEEIEVLIRMKESARNSLGRFLPLLLVACLVAPMAVRAVRAEGTCPIAVDETASVSETSLRQATSFVEDTIDDYVAAMDCTRIVVLRIGRETRFAPRTSLDIVNEPRRIDCHSMRAEPLAGHAALFNWSQNVTDGLAEDEVARCENERAAARIAYEAKRDRFRRALEAALSVSPTVEPSRIKDMVQHLSQSGQYQHILVLSDLLDRPWVPLDKSSVPEGVSVVMIALEPSHPKYGTNKEVLARAAQWERIPGVTVTTAAELNPSIWASVPKGTVR